MFNVGGRPFSMVMQAVLLVELFFSDCSSLAKVCGEKVLLKKCSWCY